MVAVYFINIFLRFHNKILPNRTGKLRGSVNRLGHSAVNAGESFVDIERKSTDIENQQSFLKRVIRES